MPPVPAISRVNDVILWTIAVWPLAATLIDAVDDNLLGGAGGLLLKAVCGGIEIGLVVGDVVLVRLAGVKGPSFLWGVLFAPVYVYRRRKLTERSLIPFYVSLAALVLALAGTVTAAMREPMDIKAGMQSLTQMGIE